MTLISILAALALEFFLGVMDDLRNFTWFERYFDWLERRISGSPLWQGPAGVLLTIAPPLIVLILLAMWLDQLHIIFSLVLAILVLVYCLGPEINTFIDRYCVALEQDDREALDRIHEQLGVDGEDGDQCAMIRALLIRSHESLFGVLFWFIILGMTGALLYALVLRLNIKFSGVHGGYGESARELHRILMWPSARLLAVGYALSGSLVDALEGWRSTGGHTLDANGEVIASSGQGALQYRPDTQESGPEFAATIREAQGLINRTLVVWLAVLGAMTIGGWLA